MTLRPWLVALLLLFAARPIAGQPTRSQAATSRGSSLRIVVVEGEDAVNIVQQRTALAPVVEVRDRNDQPVAGAVVRFAIRNGRASFNGARTLSVTTNAAGRAAAVGLTPTGSGALQIGVEASFQGQTAAATIAQTNVVTVTQSAGAAGSGGTGAGGAGGAAGGGGGSAAGVAGGAAVGTGVGGGLSGIAIGGMVGGAIGGGLVIKATTGDNSSSDQVSGGGNSLGGGSDGSGAPGGAGGSGGPGSGVSCSFAVSPTSVQAGSLFSVVTIRVTATPEGCSAGSWTASTSASFLQFTAPGPYVGSGAVDLVIGPNDTADMRTGSGTVAGQSVSVTQVARCSFAVSPTDLHDYPFDTGTHAILPASSSTR